MIKFYKGLKSKYTYPENFAGGIYFATDTGELLVDGVNYGIDVEDLKDVTFDDTSNTFVFTKGNGNKVTASLGDKLLTVEDRNALDSVKEILTSGELNVTYNSGLDSEVATVEKLGGIAANTKVSQLSGRTISSVLDELIFPTINPTFIPPKATLSLKGYASTQLVGSVAPTESNFDKNFDKGQIKIGNTKKNDRAGEATSTVLYCGSEANGMPGKVTEGTMNYYYKVGYAEGPQPTNSKGDNYGTPLTAGTVTSSAVPVYGVYKYYAGVGTNEVNIPLTNSSNIEVTIGSETGANKHWFKIPAKYTLTKVETFNTLNNSWVVYNHSTGLSTGTEDIEVNGNSVSYKKYQRTDSELNGELKYRITFTK